MSSRTIKFARSITVVPVALILHIGAAAAADSANVMQQQGPSPAGRTATALAPQNTHLSASAVRVTGDAQESARQLLQGVTTQAPALHDVSRAPNAQRSTSAVRLTGDAQESARQLLQGVTTRTRPRPPDFSGANAKVRGDAQAQAQDLLLARRDTPAARL